MPTFNDGDNLGAIRLLLNDGLTKLDGIESGATADQTGAEIKALYEAEADTNAFTDAEQSKLAGIEAGATADQTGAEIKSAYEAEADTNAFTDAYKAILDSGVSGWAVELISRLEMAGETTADFTGFDSAEYDGYLVVIGGLLPSSSGARLLVRTSSDGGATYDSGSSDYAWSLREGIIGSGSSLAFAGQDNSADIRITRTANSSTTKGVNGQIQILSPNLSQETHVDILALQYYSSGGNYQVTYGGGGVRKSAAAVDAIRLLWDAGNHASGIISLYGLRNS